MLTMPSASAKDKRDILNICKETHCELKSLPGIYQLANGEVLLSKMKSVAIEDLLGRDQIKVDMAEILISSRVRLSLSQEEAVPLEVSFVVRLQPMSQSSLLSLMYMRTMHTRLSRNSDESIRID